MPLDHQNLKAFLRKHQALINTLNVGDKNEQQRQFLEACLNIIKNDTHPRFLESLSVIEIFIKNEGLMKGLQAKAARNKVLDAFRSFSTEAATLPKQEKTLSFEQEKLREKIDLAKKRRFMENSASINMQSGSTDNPSHTKGLFITVEDIERELEMKKQKVKERKKQGITRHASDTSSPSRTSTEHDSLLFNNSTPRSSSDTTLSRSGSTRTSSSDSLDQKPTSTKRGGPK